MKVAFVIAAVLGALVCAEASVKGLGEKIECLRAREAYQTRIYEQRIRELVEGLRDQLKVGIPEKNIPALDPFELKDFRLQVNEDVAKLDWNMTGKIDGLMSWQLTDVKFNLVGLKFNFGILLENIIGKGAYSINGAILELLPVYGSGEFDVLAKDLVINGNGKIGSKGSGAEQQLFLQEFSTEISLGQFTFGVTGLMNDEQLSFLLSQMISDSLPDLIQNFQAPINKAVSSKVIAAVDKLLDGVTLQDILDLLKPKPSEYRYIDCGGY